MDEIFTKASLFTGMDISAASALTAYLQVVEFPCGYTIFAEAEPGDQLYIIGSGKVKIGKRSPDGQGILLAIMGPSDLFGELSLLDGGPRTSSAVTITEVRAVSMDRLGLRTCISSQPEAAAQLLRVLARRLRRTNDKLADQVFLDASQRVARQLLQLGQRFGSQEDGAVRVMHDLTHDEIAELAGVSPAAVNRALADFTDQGWIEWQDTSVLILDSESLSHRTRVAPIIVEPRPALDAAADGSSMITHGK